MSLNKKNDSPSPLLAKAYDCGVCEPHWSKIWSQREEKAQKKGKAFTMVIPPPNVTGKLHMGHGLVNTIQDILARFYRLQGRDVLWVPGVDHAGIATQTVVERHLIKSEGKRRTDFSREEFIDRCFQWKREHESKIYAQLERMGCSCNWEKSRFTLDTGCQKAVNQTFKTLFDRGLIYRDDYLVNWDPATQTALADDEVEHVERKSFMWHIRYLHEEDRTKSVVIATTRPETIFGDCAIAVHPKDERYKHLVGKKVITPLSGRSIPVIADSYVDPEFGSGALKITPAHDPYDYLIGQRHDLPMICAFTPDGKLAELCGKFQGLSIEEARDQVSQTLEKEGLIEQKLPHTHRVGISYRSGAPIEPMLSKQWFVRVSSFKDQIKKMVSENAVELFPKGDWENTFYHWIDHLRDWCISRQLWWGHQIPIWYHKEDPEKILCSGDLEVPEQVKEAPHLWERDSDVLDTWFSSALWPFSALGWPEEDQLIERHFPNSVLVTGHDILFFWVARMLLMGHLIHDKAPFPKVFLHGLIYAKSYWKESEQGKEYIYGQEKKEYDLGAPLKKGVFHKWEKMSKSKGNVIDPMDVMTEYGADAMRLALTASIGDSRQIDLDLRRFEEFRNFSNKLYNATRLICMHLSDEDSQNLLTDEIDPDPLDFADIWILQSFQKTKEAVKKQIEDFAFEKAVMQAYHFFWDDFCAYYLEIAKGALSQPEKKKTTQQILVVVLVGSLRLLHPFAPFITSELFALMQNMLRNSRCSSDKGPVAELARSLQHAECMLSSWPEIETSEIYSEKSSQIALEKMELFQSLLLAIRQIRAEMKIPPKVASALHLSINKSDCSLKETILSFEKPLKSFLPVAAFSVSDSDHASLDNSFGAVAQLHDLLSIAIPLPKELYQAEKNRLKKVLEEEQLQMQRLQAKLDNPSFCQRAPEELVKQTRDQLQKRKDAMTKIEDQIAKLQSS